MASGKSTFGRKLAEEMSYDFIDLDAFIEEKAGMSISDFFSKKGEAAFRTLEQKCLKEITERKRTIIATGGGTPCFFDNMKWMSEHGTTIWLDVPFATLMERLEAEHEHRPLIANRTKEERDQTIRQLLETRKPFYSQADYRILG